MHAQTTHTVIIINDADQLTYTTKLNFIFSVALLEVSRGVAPLKTNCVATRIMHLSKFCPSSPHAGK